MKKEDKNNLHYGDTVYHKRGRRYIPFAMCCDTDWFNEGVWVVKKRPGMTSITCADALYEAFKVCNIGDGVTLDQLADLKEYADRILTDRDFGKLVEKRVSLNDIVSAVVGKVFEINESMKEQKTSQNEKSE